MSQLKIFQSCVFAELGCADYNLDVYVYWWQEGMYSSSIEIFATADQHGTISQFSGKTTYENENAYARTTVYTTVIPKGYPTSSSEFGDPSAGGAMVCGDALHHLAFTRPAGFQSFIGLLSYLQTLM